MLAANVQSTDCMVSWSDRARAIAVSSTEDIRSLLDPLGGLADTRGSRYESSPLASIPAPPSESQSAPQLFVEVASGAFGFCLLFRSQVNPWTVILSHLVEDESARLGFGGESREFGPANRRAMGRSGSVSVRCGAPCSSATSN